MVGRSGGKKEGHRAEVGGRGQAAKQGQLSFWPAAPG